VTTRPRPPVDDSPAPERQTPRRLADQLQRTAEDLARVELRLQTIAAYVRASPPLERLRELVREASVRAVDVGLAVRVGRLPVLAELLDGDAGRGERPLIDHIEAVASPARPPEVPSANGTAEAPKAGKRKREKPPPADPEARRPDLAPVNGPADAACKPAGKPWRLEPLSRLGVAPDVVAKIRAACSIETLGQLDDRIRYAEDQDDLAERSGITIAEAEDLMEMLIRTIEQAQKWGGTLPPAEAPMAPDPAPPPVEEPARKPPRKSFAVFANANGDFLPIGTIKAKDLEEAKRLAPEAFAGQEVRDARGNVRPLDPVMLEVRPAPKPKPPPIPPGSREARLAHALHTSDEAGIEAVQAEYTALHDPIPGLFVAWSGRNPLYAIRCGAIEDAILHVASQHPADARIDVRPDDGTACARKLMVRDLSKPWPFDGAGPDPGTPAGPPKPAPPPAEPSPKPRAWIARDGAAFLGRFVADNFTRATMHAEERWPNVDRKKLVVRPAPPDDFDQADEFHAQFDAAEEAPKPRKKARVKP
jgi:hypothetical protein